MALYRATEAKLQSQGDYKINIVTGEDKQREENQEGEGEAEHRRGMNTRV